MRNFQPSSYARGHNSKSVIAINFNELRPRIYTFFCMLIPLFQIRIFELIFLTFEFFNSNVYILSWFELCSVFKKEIRGLKDKHMFKMESYKTQDYTMSWPKLRWMLFSKKSWFQKKRKNFIPANKVVKKMRVALLVVGKFARIKSISVQRLSIYPIINISLCREQLWCFFWLCLKAAKKKLAI